MKMRHQQFALTDPVFYETPYQVRPEDERFAVGERPLPEEWQREESGPWLHLRPKDLQLPAQGWKIHG
ncbi:hypothetical protein [Streptomyces orinoci]|uniref:RamC N-terminal domain-containing protein n=1 Tax=Streptomyces orinoci TaxID=67339 RepID=A0ABV3JRU4_STRON|nr:hypothetical protein [Streptomyces orinoci]